MRDNNLNTRNKIKLRTFIRRRSIFSMLSPNYYRFSMKNQILYSLLFYFFIFPAWSLTTRLSVNDQGVEGNSNSFLLSSTALSAEGRYVAFSSEASNLVAEDRNNTFDIFVYDTWLPNVIRVSVDAQGQEGNLTSQTPSLSANGRYVAFSSFADNLVPGDTNQASDIFIYDMQTRSITRIVPPSGQESNGHSFHPSFSAEGNEIAFDSQANNWVVDDDNPASDIFVYHRQTDTVQRISTSGDCVHPHLSANGRYVAFEAYGIFSQIVIHDLYTHQTRSLTPEANGNSFSPFISSEGQYVAFTSEATNLVPHDVPVSDIFIQNLYTNRIISLHVDDQASFPVLSEEGRYLVFSSYATHLVPHDTNGTVDVFRYEQETQQVERINLNNQHQESDLGPFPTPVATSSSGCTIAFDSSATNLVSHDTNNSFDVFVHQIVTQSPIFDSSTMILDLPTVQVIGEKIYHAQLHLPSAYPSTFILHNIEPISFQNTSCAYFSPDTGLLYLPLVEVHHFGQNILYEVVMHRVSSSDSPQFEIVRINPR